MSADEHSMSPQRGSRPGVTGRLQGVLLGEEPTLTRTQICEQSGVSLARARELWRLLGFPLTDDNEVAFTSRDVAALEVTKEMMDFGVLRPESQAALVRTLARSFARLAEWQTRLLAEIGETEEIGDEDYLALVAEVMPRIESVQNNVWRRHLASASASRLATEDSSASGEMVAACFVDIVGYTSRSRELDESELSAWIERFEGNVTEVVVDHGGQVIKTIGDEVMFTVSDPDRAAEIGLVLAGRGADEEDAFPWVRVGIAYGEVLQRLGDVFGPTVNIAARLTSIGRPGTVLVDQGVHDVICQAHAPEGTRREEFKLKRLPRASVKGYHRLHAWTVRRAR